MTTEELRTSLLAEKKNGFYNMKDLVSAEEK